MGSQRMVQINMWKNSRYRIMKKEEKKEEEKRRRRIHLSSNKNIQ